MKKRRGYNRNMLTRKMSRKVINRELDRLEKIESRNLDIDTYIVQNLRKFVFLQIQVCEWHHKLSW